MTLLRKLAQLVQDLYTIRAILEGDQISSQPYGSKPGDTNCIAITIKYDRGDRRININTKVLIANCIFEEFSKDEYRIEEYSEELENEISVVFFRKYQPI